jgi:membrane-associated phospholipid phosphatase
MRTFLLATLAPLLVAIVPSISRAGGIESRVEAFDMVQLIDTATIDTTAPAAHSVGSDMLSWFGGLGHVLTSPLRWNGNDALVAGMFVAGTGGSFLLDDEVRTVMLRNRNPLNDALKPIGNGYATVLYMGPAALLLWASGAVAGNDWMRETGNMLVTGVFAIGVIQIPVSITVGRARPFFNEGNASAKLFAGTNDDRASFFSGHSMVAFCFSTILSHQIDNTWATVGLYTLATMGPLARLYIDKHWFSDTVIGSALGTFVGETIWKWHAGKKTTGDSGRLQFYPVPGGMGVMGVF